MAGWSVFTRPSSISGNWVTSLTSVTAIPASLRALAVPPVEINWIPKAERPRAKLTSPVLSVTLSSALAILAMSHYCLTYSGSGFPLVSGAKGNAASPTKKTRHMVTPAYRMGS